MGISSTGCYRMRARRENLFATGSPYRNIFKHGSIIICVVFFADLSIIHKLKQAQNEDMPVFFSTWTCANSEVARRPLDGCSFKTCLVRLYGSRVKKLPKETDLKEVQIFAVLSQKVIQESLPFLVMEHNETCFRWIARKESQVLKSTTVHMASKAGSLTGGGLTLGAPSELSAVTVWHFPMGCWSIGNTKRHQGRRIIVPENALWLVLRTDNKLNARTARSKCFQQLTTNCWLAIRNSRNTIVCSNRATPKTYQSFAVGFHLSKQIQTMLRYNCKLLPPSSYYCGYCQLPLRCLLFATCYHLL